MGLNVLVVDDSPIMRKMITKAMMMSGIPVASVVEAGNGKEALDVLDDRWVDLALVDINMPVMSGTELIEVVRQSDMYRDLPIVVVSTEGSRTRVEGFLEQGIGFVHKPFAPAQLREVIQQITGVQFDGHDDSDSSRSDNDF